MTRSKRPALVLVFTAGLGWGLNAGMALERWRVARDVRSPSSLPDRAYRVVGTVDSAVPWPGFKP